YELSAGKMVDRAWPLEDKITVVFETSGSLDIPVLSSIRRPGWNNLSTYLQTQCVFRNGTMGNGNRTTQTLIRRQATEDTDPKIPYEEDESPALQTGITDP